MAARPTLADLAERKRLLVLQSEAQRLLLAADLERVTAPIRWWDRTGPRLRAWILLAAPIFGGLAARRLHGRARWLALAAAALQVLRAWRPARR